MMTEAETILKMIETVDPADTAKLDDIDVAFWRFYSGLPIGEISCSYGEVYYSFPDDWDYAINVYEKCPSGHPLQQVTRSRDALKAIRPEGWNIYCDMTAINFDPFKGWIFALHSTTHGMKHVTPSLRMEELAELHAIIQAIEYERSLVGASG